MTTTRSFRWDHAGAPSLTGQAGAFKDLMKAVLIGSAGVAYGSGASAKAAAGWSNAFPADETTTKIAIRNSLAAGGNGCYLRIDDSHAQYAIVRMYESMTDIDTGTASAANVDLYIPKSTAASSATRAWVVIADERTFWGCTLASSSTPAPGEQNNLSSFGGGDVDSFIPSDPSCFIAANDTTDANTTCGLFFNSTSLSVINGAGIFLSRDSLLSVASTPFGVLSMNATSTTSATDAIGGSLRTLASPMPGYVGDVCVNAFAAAGGTLRARLRGLFIPLSSLGPTTSVGSTKAFIGQPGGSLMVAIGGQTNTAITAPNRGRLFVETVQSWG